MVALNHSNASIKTAKPPPFADLLRFRIDAPRAAPLTPPSTNPTYTYDFKTESHFAPSNTGFSHPLLKYPAASPPTISVVAFLSRDPIEYKGSEWNLYEFLESNPIKNLDPDGKLVGYVGAASVVAAFACAYPYAEYANRNYGGESDKFRHCWVSCQASKTCGTQLTMIAGMGKEARDRAIALYCIGNPTSALCNGGHGDFWDSLSDIGANSTCTGYIEQYAACGFVISWFRESCTACCARSF